MSLLSTENPVIRVPFEWRLVYLKWALLRRLLTPSLWSFSLQHEEDNIEFSVHSCFCFFLLIFFIFANNKFLEHVTKIWN